MFDEVEKWKRQLSRRYHIESWGFYQKKRPDFVTAPKSVYEKLAEYISKRKDVMGEDLVLHDLQESDFQGADFIGHRSRQSFSFRGIPVRMEGE